LSRNDVLLLDEPTNHLDFETVEAFGIGLKAFNGTVVFISHDRTFVNMMATQIVEVKDGKVVRYPGNYEEYVYSMEKRVREELLGDEEKKPAPKKSAVKAPPAAHKKASHDPVQQLKAERTKVNSQARDIHKRIERHKTEWETINRTFTTDPLSWEHDRNTRYEYLQKSIKEDEDVWLSLMEQVETLTAKIDGFKAKERGISTHANDRHGI
jgi:ATP-binding cassette, subfamily F, member 3